MANLPGIFAGMSSGKEKLQDGFPDKFKSLFLDIFKIRATGGCGQDYSLDDNPATTTHFPPPIYFKKRSCGSFYLVIITRNVGAWETMGDLNDAE